MIVPLAMPVMEVVPFSAYLAVCASDCRLWPT
jgi:hypothetical protein